MVDKSITDIKAEVSKMSWIKDNKTEIQLITAMLLILFGCTLIMMGFWVYPLGVIHNSILIAFGEMLTFAGAVLVLTTITR